MNSFDFSIVLLAFIRDSIDLMKCLDGHWVTPQGVSVPYDVSVLRDCFYRILLPELLKMDDLSDVLRCFIDELVQEVSE